MQAIKETLPCPPITYESRHSWDYAFIFIEFLSTQYLHLFIFCLWQRNLWFRLGSNQIISNVSSWALLFNLTCKEPHSTKIYHNHRFLEIRLSIYLLRNHHSTKYTSLFPASLSIKMSCCPACLLCFQTHLLFCSWGHILWWTGPTPGSILRKHALQCSGDLIEKLGI